MVYTPDHPPVPDSADLRARIPGWGADLDPADRPAVPRMRFDPAVTGAHWTLPEQQPERRPRERSIEHARLTPVFGTSAPLHGLSGMVRRFAYRRYSEGRAAHWLLLIGADRIDAAESRLGALVRLRPDNPITETGITTEFTHHGWRSRVGTTRVDTSHTWIDPLLNTAPWLLAGVLVARAARRRATRWT